MTVIHTVSGIPIKKTQLVATRPSNGIPQSYGVAITSKNANNTWILPLIPARATTTDGYTTYVPQGPGQDPSHVYHPVTYSEHPAIRESMYRTSGTHVFKVV